MTIPDLCRRIGRPALIYVIYFLFGLVLSPWFSHDIQGIVVSIGEIGFILLLFEIGLEIDLPKPAEMLIPVKLMIAWGAAQVPLMFLLSTLAGLSFIEATFAFCGLCACSVGIAFPGWWHYPGGDPKARIRLLHWMILLEVGAMVVLASGSTLLRHGTGPAFILTLGGIVVAILAMGLFADKVAGHVARLSRNTLRWRVHYWILFVLLAAAAGRWVGLAPGKTAFFLGLFISRTTHEGLALEHHLRPIGQHLLIPVFFISLGALVPPEYWVSWVGFNAAVSAALILLFRRLLQGWLFRNWGGDQVYLLVTPNLTIAAVAAQIMSDAGLPAGNTAWILMTSAILTLYSLLALRLGKTVAGTNRFERSPNIGPLGASQSEEAKCY